MAGDKITIDVEVKGAKQAANDIETLNEALAQTKEEARNIFAKGMSESLPEQLQDVAKGFSIARDQSQSYSTRIQATVGASMIAKNAFMDLATRLIDLSRAFGEARAAQEQNDRAMRALGAGYEAVRAATAGSTSATEAMTMRQSLLRAGLTANAETLSRVSRLGREYAQTWGGTTTEAVNTFVEAIRSGEAEALQPFGVRIDRTKTAAERLEQAMAQLQRRYENLAPAEQNATEQNAAFERGLTEMRNRALAGVDQALGHIPSGFRALAVWLGNANTAQNAMNDSTDDAARALERQTQAVRATATATAQLAEEISKADREMKSFEETLREAPDYTMRANETFQDAVSRSAQQAMNAVGRARRQQEIQRAVMRSLGRMSDEERAAAGLPANTPIDMEAIRRAMAEAVRRKQVANAEFNNQLVGSGGAGWRDPRGSAYSAGMLLDNTEALAAMRADLETKQRDRLVYLAQIEEERRQAEEQRASDAALGRKAGESEQLTQAWRLGRERNLGLQLGNRLGLRDSLQENLTAPIQGAADSVKGAFDQMSSGLNSFLDTLIESPEEVGTASVQIAKNFLKGLSMMALQESLFNLAKGVAASFTPGMQASAAGYFTASAIFAGVAAATGAGAAGIAAQQRGAQQVPAAANGGSSGPARVDGGNGRNGNREMPMYTININGSVLDQGGFEDAIVRGIRRANGRGAN